MESLQIRTGLIKLQILDDNGEERGIFCFNPDDIGVANKFFKLVDELSVKQEEFNSRISEVTNTSEQLELLDEIVTYFKDMIDDCFGAGSSQILFGDAKTLSMFNDFFTGITPYYAKSSEKRESKYKNTIESKRSRKSSK